MHDCKPVSILLLVNYKLSLSMSPSNKAEWMKLSQTPYASAMGNVFYDLYKTKHCTSSGSDKSIHGKFGERALKYS